MTRVKLVTVVEGRDAVTTEVPLGRRESLRVALVQARAALLLELIGRAREALERDGRVSPELWDSLYRALDATLEAL